MTLEGRPSFIFGGHPEKSQVTLLHPSISRCHAALIIDQDAGVLFVDLMSRAGVTLNDNKLTPLIPSPLKNGDKITFGLSTRTYKIEMIDYSGM